MEGSFRETAVLPPSLLAALLRRERLVPVVHGTTYEELEKVSLLLASRAGLNTDEEPMVDVAAKIAELVAI